MITLIIFVLSLLIIFVSWLNLIRDCRKLDLPGPFPVPIFGNGHLFFGNSNKFLITLKEIAEKYGNTTRLHILNKRYILTSDPKYVEAVTSNVDLTTKGDSYHFLHPWLGRGLLTASGRRWKTHRKFLTPAFHFNILQNFLPVFLKNEKIFIEKLYKLADGKTIDLFPIMALLALDNVTESIMGVSFNAQTDKESEYVKCIEELSKILAMRMRSPIGGVDALFNWMPEKKIHDKAIKILHGHSNRVIQSRREELKQLDVTTLNYDCDHGIKNKYAFLDLLLLAEVNGTKLDDQSVREEVDTFMFEGHDTTTSGMVFTLFCVSRNKEVQQKLFEEQKSILGEDIEKEPTYSEIQNMKYLELVIKESLRLYPSVPMIEREITKDTEIAGLFVPKDTSFLIDIKNMQMNPDYFEDPMEFRPERFEQHLKYPFSWLPFSAGSRNCIGQKFAMLEIKVTVSAFIRKFILLPSDIDPELSSDLILRSNNGVLVIVKPRYF